MPVDKDRSGFCQLLVDVKPIGGQSSFRYLTRLGSGSADPQ
jgi:hypothetical protein